MDVKYFVIACSCLVFVFVVEMIRQEKMTFKYAMSWLGLSSLAVLLSLWDGLLLWVSHLAGFAIPSNFIFFLISFFVIFLSLLLTVYTNAQSRRTEILAQSIAILEYKLRERQTQKQKSDPV